MHPLARRFANVFALVGLVSMAEAGERGTLLVLKTVIGQDALSLVRQSSVNVDLGPVSDTMLYGIAQPVQVEYGDAADSVRLPPAATVSLRIVAGHVIDVRIMPQVKVLDAREAMTLVKEIDSLLVKRGWTRGPPHLSFEEAAIRLGAPRAQKQRVDLGKWQGPRGDLAGMRIDCSRAAGWSLQNLVTADKRDCMVTLMIENERAYTHFSEEMRRLRAEDGLGDVPARPIDLPAYLQRVRR